MLRRLAPIGLTCLLTGTSCVAPPLGTADHPGSSTSTFTGIPSPLPSPPGAPTAAPSAIAPETRPLLPASVYFLARPTTEVQAWQVWRLEPDGVTQSQLTYEESGVDDFSVSTEDGSLAFVTDNRLYLTDRDGKHRRLIADGTKVDPGIEDYAHRGFVGSPSLSPDAQTLAYAFDGLHLYDVATGEDRRVLTNLGNLLGEPFVFAKEDYAPGPWSPDGRRLLILMAYFEGSTLAVMQPGESQPFQRMWSDGPVCCTYHWTPDSGSILVANPNYTVVWPGLWRYDAESGQRRDLVSTRPGSSEFVGWPVELPSGDLLFFYGNRLSLEEGIPLVLVRSGPDGMDRSQVRPEAFRIGDALWAEDGSLALLVQVEGPGQAQLILARPDPAPLQTLIEGLSIIKLAWGPSLDT